MKLIFEVTKYDIIGMASLMGISEKEMEMIEKYISENESMDIDYYKENKNCPEIKTAVNALAITQIAKNINL